MSDPRAGQSERLKAEVMELKDRITVRDAAIRELQSVRAQAVSQLAAQYEEITRLRGQSTLAAQEGNVRRLPGEAGRTAPSNSCS
ncbi:hypothetical protein [Streptomyces adonidis]|uniref:hypothetical protein n=1 Tax=Streptomyces adonidis TaxID=3231367 RepID=UPI0034DB65DC